MAKVEHLNAFHSVSGHLYEAEGHLLQRLATGKRVLDIGTHHGRSAVALAGTAESVVTVDNYLADIQIQAPDFATTAWNISACGLGHKIRIYREDCFSFIRREGLKNFDMVFYDGPHIPPAWEKTFLEFALETGYDGLIAIHDYKGWDPDMSYVVEAVDWYEKESGRIRIGPVHGQSIVWFESLTEEFIPGPLPESIGFHQE